MILNTHVIVGAATAQFFPNRPVLTFFAGFISHYLIDTLPHWDYELLSAQEDLNNPMNSDMAINKDFLIDLLKVFLDFCFGIFVSFLIFTKSEFPPLWMMTAIVGSVFPDVLAFFYWKIKKEPLTSLQRLHIWTQKCESFKIRPFLGFSLQLSFALIIALIVKFFI